MNELLILDFGEVDGLAYIVLPYIGSGTLGDRLVQGPLNPADGSRVVQQLASALASAHAAGVIHRDVKPSNVLLDAPGHEPDSTALGQDEIELVLRVNGKRRGRLVVPASADRGAIEAAARASSEVAKHAAGAAVKKVVVVPGRLVNVVV